MADTPSFSHISVTSDDEDEFVIEAGAVPRASAMSHAQKADAHEADRARRAAAAGADARESGAGADARELEADAGSAREFEASSHATGAADEADADVARKPEASSDAGQRASSSARAARDDAYQPTTLEDIESSRMPLMQKVIIAVALVGIVAFAVWCWVL